jgi:hypothetical protein
MTHLHWSWAWGFMTDWDTPSRDAHRPERADSRRRVKHAAGLGRTQSVDGVWDSLCPRPSTKCATSRRTGTTPSTCRYQLGAVTHGGMRTEASSTASKSWFPAYGSPRPGPVMGCQVPAFTGLWSRPAAGLDAPAARRTDGERNCAWPYLDQTTPVRRRHRRRTGHDHADALHWRRAAVALATEEHLTRAREKLLGRCLLLLRRAGASSAQ